MSVFALQHWVILFYNKQYGTDGVIVLAGELLLY
jgi:hypothetical protein